MGYLDDGGGGGVANTANLDTQESPLDMGGHLIRNVQTPVTDSDAATKLFVMETASTPGPPGPGGEAGRITHGKPHNALEATFYLNYDVSGTPKTAETGFTDGDTITLDGITYTWKDQLDSAFASVLVTFTDIPADGDTITLGGQTFRFKTVMEQPYDILIGADANECATNLRHGISMSDSNVAWITGMTTSDIYGYDLSTITSGVPTITDGSFRPIAQSPGAAGNGKPATTTSSVITLSSSTFTGGTSGTPNQLKLYPIDGSSAMVSDVYAFQYAFAQRDDYINSFGLKGVMFTPTTQPSSRFTSNNAAPLQIVGRVAGASMNDLEIVIDTANSNIIWLDETMTTFGLDCTTGTEGDSRVDSSNIDGQTRLYVLSADVTHTYDKPWRVITLGVF